MIQLVGEILDQFEEDECRADLRHYAAQQLVIRASDSVMVNRAATMEALVSLQNEDGVLGAYTDAMQDQNSTVRRTALKYVDLAVHGSDHILLQAVMERLSDVTQAVRTMAFRKLLGVPMRILERNDVLTLLRHANEHDKCWDVVRRWLAQVDGDWARLLRRWRVVQHEDLVEQVLLACAPEMKFSSQFFKQYVDDLTKDTSLVWRVYFQFCALNEV